MQDILDIWARIKKEKTRNFSDSIFITRQCSSWDGLDIYEDITLPLKAFTKKMENGKEGSLEDSFP